MDVVGIGQISLDRVARLPAWPRSGMKVALGAAPAVQAGGQIATAVLAAVRLGLRGRFLGAVGDDADGDLALAPLCSAGVDLSGVRRVAGAPTRSALVLVDARDGERTVLAYRDPRLALRAGDLSRAAIRDARALLLDAEDPDASRWAAAVARESGVASVLDVDRADPDRLRLAKEVDFPIVSASFCADPSNWDSERDALASLVAAGVRMAVATRGARGALARVGSELIEQPAFAVDALDTTGAGDVFRGAFVWALLRGEPARRVLELAATAAALACRGAGAQGALPSAAEVAQHAGRRGQEK